MSFDELPPEYRRERVDVYSFLTLDEVRRDEPPRSINGAPNVDLVRPAYLKHDVAHVLREANPRARLDDEIVFGTMSYGGRKYADILLVCADDDGRFDIDHQMVFDFNFDMRSLPRQLDIAVWHANLIADFSSLAYLVDADNVTVQKIIADRPRRSELCRQAYEIELIFTRTRLNGLAVRWSRLAAGEPPAIGQRSMWISWLEHAPRDTQQDLQTLGDELDKAYEMRQHLMEPVATIYVWRAGGRSKLYREGDRVDTLLKDGMTEGVPPSWIIGGELPRLGAYRSDMPDLLVLNGPANTRAQMLAVLQRHERAQRYASSYHLCASAAAPPIDTHFRTKWLAAALNHELRGQVKWTHDANDVQDILERCLVQATRCRANDRSRLVPADDHAVLRWPTQLRVLVEWCMLMYDWQPELPAYVVMWVLEWTDAPFNWRGSEARRINAIQRVRDSRRKVRAAQSARV